MHNLTMEELIAENTALKAKISAIDKQEPATYGLFEYNDEPNGERLDQRVFPFREWAHEHINEVLAEASVKQCGWLRPPKVIPLFTRPLITSERELALLAVIEQKHTALLDLKNQVNKFCEEEGEWGFYTGDAEKALALTPDLSALKEHDAKALEAAANCCRKISYERFAEYGTTETDTGAGYYTGLDSDERDIRDEEDNACADAIRRMAEERRKL